jgi:hypothetical protein
MGGCRGCGSRVALRGIIRGSGGGPIRPVVAGVIRPWVAAAPELAADCIEVVAIRTGLAGVEIARLIPAGGFEPWRPVGEEIGEDAGQDRADVFDSAVADSAVAIPVAISVPAHTSNLTGVTTVTPQEKLQ